MSAHAMDIDHASSREKKRKNKEKDRHSSKKRKQAEDEMQVVDSPPKKEKKEKKEKHRKHKHEKSGVDVAETPASSLQEQSVPSATKKKHSRHAHRHAHSESSAPTSEDEEAGTASGRKPLSKPTESQLASLSAESDESSSPFHLVTTSLYVPLSPISISATDALPSLLCEHISPLLLTYYPPVRGIIFAYSNPSISSTPSSSQASTSANPQPLTPAITAGEYGVLYVYLNITFLVFRPERSQTLEGWVNVQSESFLGAVVFNLFSVGIERRRLPADWKWIAPGQQQKQHHDVSQQPGSDDNSSSVDSDKENFRPLPAGLSAHDADGDDEVSTGFFQTSSGKRVRGTIRFRVRDVDVIPGSERDKGFISLEGTMLSDEEEEKLVEKERKKVERITGGGKAGGEARMAGALTDSTPASTPDTAASVETGGEKRRKKKSKTASS